MSVILGGVTCEEIIRNYGENADIRSGIGSRKGYLCGWSQRFTVAQALLGLSSAASVGGAITLILPSKHPELNNCYCTGVEFEPVGKPSQGAYLEYTNCIVWGVYSTPNFTWNSSPMMNIEPTMPFIYAEQELDVGTEVITLPGSKLKFSGGGPLDQDYGLKITLVDMRITLFRVPYLPGAAIIGKAGALNDAVYLGVAAGQLIYNGANNRLNVLSDGTYTQDITYSFTARQYPWDYAYDGTRSGWYKILRADGSDLVTRQSFAGLFPDEYV